MLSRTIYLDNNATMPLRPAAFAAMQSAMGAPANPSSVHGFGRDARLIIENARESVAALVGCQPADVVFTSGGTEANNLVLHQYDYVITSTIEHDSVLQLNGVHPLITVDSSGVIELSSVLAAVDLVDASRKPQTLISVMAANNETGVVQPITEIAAIAKAAGIAFHSDMVQIFGKVHINFAASDIGYASLSAHKIGGPAGVGALIVRPGLRLTSLFQGGGQEHGRRAGTENLIGIAGFGAAANEAFGDVGHYVKMAGWRDDFERRVSAARNSITVFGGRALRLGNTSCIATDGKPAETMVMAFDIAGIAISAGAACSSGKLKASHVLQAMGAGMRAGEAIRISGGWATARQDFETLAEVFLHLYKQPKSVE